MTYVFAVACGAMLMMGVAEWADGDRRPALVSWAMAGWLGFTAYVWA